MILNILQMCDMFIKTSYYELYSDVIEKFMLMICQWKNFLWFCSGVASGYAWVLLPI